MESQRGSGERAVSLVATAGVCVSLAGCGGKIPRRIATYPTIRQPNTVAVDPATGDIFIASRSNATLQPISPTVRSNGKVAGQAREAVAADQGNDR